MALESAYNYRSIYQITSIASCVQTGHQKWTITLLTVLAKYEPYGMRYHMNRFWKLHQKKTRKTKGTGKTSFCTNRFSPYSSFIAEKRGESSFFFFHSDKLKAYRKQKIKNKAYTKNGLESNKPRPPHCHYKLSL